MGCAAAALASTRQMQAADFPSSNKRICLQTWPNGGARQEDQNAPPGESHCSQEQGRGSLRLRCLFLFGCARSSRRRRLFSGCSETEATLPCGAEPSWWAPLLQGSGAQLSSGGTRALRVAPLRRGGIFLGPEIEPVSCVGRRILYR